MKNAGFEISRLFFAHLYHYLPAYIVKCEKFFIYPG